MRDNIDVITSAESSPSFAERLRRHGASLAPAARRVARFIAENRAVALASSALELATRTNTSDATVVRAVQALGFAGLGELKQALVAELGQPTPADTMRRTLAETGADSERAIGLVLTAHRQAIDSLESAGSRAALRDAVTLLRPAARIVVFGIGPSAPLAAYVTTMLRRAGRPSATLASTGSMLADQLLDLRAGDALIALAYGRAYPEAVAVFDEAARLCLPLVLLTDSPEGRLARAATLVLPARRGRADRVALHAATLVTLEAIVLGLAAADAMAAVSTLERLNHLREAISGRRDSQGSS